MSDRYSIGISASVSKSVSDKLEAFMKVRKLPIGRLIAMAIENELMKGVDAFTGFDLEQPSEPYEEYKYSDEASKILKYITKYGQMGLDMLLVLRHDMGIPDAYIFKLAFRELVEKEMVEKCTPYTNVDPNKYPEGYTHWRLAKEFRPTKVKVARKKATEFETYLRLDKKYKLEK